MKTKFDEELGRVMRTTRKEKHISIDTMALRLHVSVPAVHYWETGQRQINASTLRDYCDVLGVKMQYVFDRMEAAQ